MERPSLSAGKLVWIVRHDGPTGMAIVRRLWCEGCNLVLTTPSQLDLSRRKDLASWMKEQRPDVVVIADGSASSRGGAAKSPRASRRVLENVLETAHRIGVERLVCVVPTLSRPLLFDPGLGALLGPGRSQARTAMRASSHAIELTRDYVQRYGCRFVALAAPTVYAPNWSAEWGPPHFLSGLVSSFGLALLQGARRFALVTDFARLPPMMHAADLADATAFAANHDDGHAFLRCGPTESISVEQLLRIVADVVGFRGPIDIRYRRRTQAIDERPIGRSIESLGWKGRFPLRDGIVELYHAWFTSQIAATSGRFLRQ